MKIQWKDLLASISASIGILTVLFILIWRAYGKDSVVFIVAEKQKNLLELINKNTQAISEQKKITRETRYDVAKVLSILEKTHDPRLIERVNKEAELYKNID